jgi:hypothetical protein
VTVKATVVVCESVPEVPVIVSVAAPTVAVAEALSVNVVLLPVLDAGLKLAVTPLGRPLTLNATLPVNPPVLVMATEVEPDVLRATDKLDGEADSEKSAAITSFTVNATVAVCDNDPDVPVIVTVAAPSVAVEDAFNVSVAAVPVVDAGLKLAVTPLGKPLAVNATLPAKPPVLEMAMEVLPEAPRLIERLAGVVASEKSGCVTSETVKAIVVAAVTEPDVPVMVMFDVPSVAVLEAVSVNVELLPVVEAGLKLAVTPLGSPLAVNATLPVNPLVRAMLMVAVALALRVTFTLAGVALSVKPGVLFGSLPNTRVPALYTGMFLTSTGVDPGVVATPV